MNDEKCKGCQWYNKPYWSIINPCDNCPRENTNVEIFTRWQDPTIEELKKEIERLNKELDKTRLSELNKEYIIYELERILQLEVLKTRENSEYNKGLTNAFNYAIHMISELKGADEE